jgi:hypothetical protein
MEPYGHLEGQGWSDYQPPNGGSRSGVNSCDLIVKAGGSYVLTVFDGSNRGGRVSLQVEEPE